MILADILKMEIDVDVFNDVIDWEPVAFVGPSELTDYGKEYFKDILSCEVAPFTPDTVYIVVKCRTEEKCNLLYRLLYVLAGYVTETTYNNFVKN